MSRSLHFEIDATLIIIAIKIDWKALNIRENLKVTIQSIEPIKQEINPQIRSHRVLMAVETNSDKLSNINNKIFHHYRFSLVEQFKFLQQYRRPTWYVTNTMFPSAPFSSCYKEVTCYDRGKNMQQLIILNISTAVHPLLVTAMQDVLEILRTNNHMELIDILLVTQVLLVTGLWHGITFPVLPLSPSYILTPRYVLDLSVKILTTSNVSKLEYQLLIATALQGFMDSLIHWNLLRDQTYAQDSKSSLLHKLVLHR